jgi:adenine-specific DNA-methyltransferase
MDEIFGQDNALSMISYRTSSPLGASGLPTVCDFILWYAKNPGQTKYRQVYAPKDVGLDTEYTWAMGSDGSTRRLSQDELQSNNDLVQNGKAIFARGALYSSGYTATCVYPFQFRGVTYTTEKKSWRTNQTGMARLINANRLIRIGALPYFVQYHLDFPAQPLNNLWTDTRAALGKQYVVETSPTVTQRCILMATDPGDLVLDPTCGSGTTAYVAEQWGRRWITIDTSRVALALARARVMGARYSYYQLRDRTVRQGFVYETVPHITLKSIANNAEIDVIWEKYQPKMEALREELNRKLGKKWEEWEIPREQPEAAPWWELRIARQKEIDASIAAKAETEYLYDKPHVDSKKVRVAGPFTVESLSPHRVLAVDENDEIVGRSATFPDRDVADFATIILENLRTSGVQQAHKEDKIAFASLVPWPGDLVCAEGRYLEGDRERRAGILIGPEFGTVSRPDLVAAAREAGDAGFDVLIACAFNFDAHSSEFQKLGRIPVLKARMNADLHMAADLKNTGKGNLFVIFGEPDIEIQPAEEGKVRVKVNGVDVFHPSTGEIRSDGAEGIACWFLDTDYNEESFFVRHAYFLGANDPYKSLKTTLKSEIDEEAWASLNSDTSRPFEKPKSGRIAVKVINHLGDEVMKVFRV